MAFVSCRFSLPSYMDFVSCRFSLPFIFGFCFMPFFPSLYTWLLFHAVFPFPLNIAFVSWRFSLLSYMDFVSCCLSLPFIFGFCFTPFFPSIHIWLLFHAVFPFPLYMAFVSCRFSLPSYLDF